MPIDPAVISETKSWASKAANDLRAAEHDLTAAPPLLADAVFHCQQAIEKILKAFLTWKGQTFRKVHDLGEIGHQCVLLDSNLEPLLRKAAPLTEYAWKFRYPGEAEEPTNEEAMKAIEIAREVFTIISSEIPKDGE